MHPGEAATAVPIIFTMETRLHMIPINSITNATEMQLRIPMVLM